MPAFCPSTSWLCMLHRQLTAGTVDFHVHVMYGKANNAQLLKC